MLREWLDNPIFVKHVRSRLRPQALATSAAVTLMICLCIMYGTYRAFAFTSGDGFTALLVLQFVLLAIMGSTQVGASVGTARASGILDFHRVSPLSPLELTLGFLFGAPVREYLLVALTLPFMLFCVMMGYPDLRGLIQAEILLLFAALPLHAVSLLGGLAMKGGVSGQNASGLTVVIGIFVVGPLYGAFRYVRALIDGDLHLDLFFLPLPWLAFLLIHLIAALAFFMIAATRKMTSERMHGATKLQAISSMAVLGALAVGGMSNWSGDGAVHMFVLYGMVVAALILVGIPTPALAEYDKALRRARKEGRASLSPWSDPAPNRPTVAAIAGILLVVGTLLGSSIVDDTLRPNLPSSGGFPLSVAVAVLVVAYYGLSYQYFLLRFGRRSSSYFGLFLFVAWAVPLVLGVISLAASGPINAEPRIAPLFSATPIVGIAAAAGVFANEAGPLPAMVAITLALFFAFVFNMLYTKAVRRVKATVERDSPGKVEPEFDRPEAEPDPEPAAVG